MKKNRRSFAMGKKRILSTLAAVMLLSLAVFVSIPRTASAAGVITKALIDAALQKYSCTSGR